jgi:hypothetical protein
MYSYLFIYLFVYLLAEMPGIARAGWPQKYPAPFRWAKEIVWTLWRTETRSRGNGSLTTLPGQQSLSRYPIVGALLGIL